MANKKVDPLVKQVGVCGCVTQETKELLIKEAVIRKDSLAKVIGSILEGWATVINAVDKSLAECEREYLPYRHHQEEKEKKGGKEYKEGPLGMILKKKH